MKKQLFYLLLAAGVLSACGPAAPQLGKDSVEDVIGAMTLEEKAHLVIGTGMVGTSGVRTLVEHEGEESGSSKLEDVFYWKRCTQSLSSAVK